MTTPTIKLDPSVLIGNIDLGQRIQKNLNDVNSFSKSIDISKIMITYFKYKNEIKL